MMIIGRDEADNFFGFCQDIAKTSSCLERTHTANQMSILQLRSVKIITGSIDQLVRSSY